MKTAPFKLWIATLIAVVTVTGCEKAKEPLVDVAALDPTIVIEMRYSSKRNFTHKNLSGLNRCYLRLSVAERLVRVQDRLQKQGYGLKVWDAYRPMSVQKALREASKDNPYIADPGFMARHPRGAAVDATLVDSRGREIEMPTRFDQFSSAASRRSNRGKARARRNLEILEDAMRQEGFLPLPSEWWHFDDPDWRLYPALDIPLEELEKQYQNASQAGRRISTETRRTEFR